MTDPRAVVMCAASRGYKKIVWVLLNWNKAKGGHVANPNMRDMEG